MLNSLAWLASSSELMGGKSWNQLPILSVIYLDAFINIYLIESFYLSVGAGFYLWYKHDFEMGSAHGMFKRRRLNKLCKRNHINMEKLVFLEEYIAALEAQIKVLKNEG